MLLPVGDVPRSAMRHDNCEKGQCKRIQEMQMKIRVNCDDHICCDDELNRRVEGVIAGTLAQIGEHLSWDEVS